MITLLILLILAVLLGVGFAITGALIAALVWICIKLPIAIMLFAIGIMLCCTIILIPLGLSIFGTALSILF